ncbi:cfem domain-containing protein [Apiospora saccharicola]|uniref:Cfem domain-containing protein n=1 Tax=Apiospora saccharicola TaxID=335842 RepID=A0ABR1WCS4_9PEZI
MVWVGITLMTTFYVAYIIIVTVACAPWPSEHDGWLDQEMAQRCNDIAVRLILAAAYFSLLTDIYILAIPLHQIPQLRLSRKRKVGLSFIFLTGLFMSEINIGLVALSMPIILAQLVGHLADIGRSLSSWIRSRRTPPNSGVDSESVSDLAPTGDHAQRSQGQGNGQQLPPPQIPDATLSGMRKFIRNLQRSRVTSSVPPGPLSGHETIDRDASNYLRTFDDLTSADFSYHIQLKALRASESTLGVERGGKVGEIQSTRGFRK